MPRKLILVVLALILIMSSSAFSAAKENRGKDKNQQLPIFNDIQETPWAENYIIDMKSKNIFQGYPDGTFRPNAPIKRIEAVVAVVRMSGLEEEALDKSEGSLIFQDAQQIQKKYPWAVGYMLVAVGEGFLDLTENNFQAEKPATRAWVASLLVRALGLEEEAQEAMNVMPQFKDAKAIPAAYLGYINVAVEKGLVKGYTDHTVQPNKPVTRAEMAALLSRATNELTIEVEGVVTEINFSSTTVTNAVYETCYGTITIRTNLDIIKTYSICEDLPVSYQGASMTAAEIQVGDLVKLLTKDGVVLEATLLSKEPS